MRKSAVATKAKTSQGIPLPGKAYRDRPRLHEDLDYWLSFKSVKKWLGGLNPDGQRKRIYGFARYARWRQGEGLEGDLDELIRICDEGKVKDLKQQALELKAWLESDDFQGIKKSSRDRYQVDVRAFYAASMIELPKFKVVVPTSQVQGLALEQEVTGLKFLEMVKKVLANGRLILRDRAVTLFIVQTFTDNSTLAKVHNVYAFPQLTEFFGTEDYHRWDVSKCPAGPIYFARPKLIEGGHELDPKRLPYTFVHVDALEALKDWLDERRRQTGKDIEIHRPAGPRHLPTSDPIFLMADGRPMHARHPTNVFLESGKRAKVNIVPSGPRPNRFQGATLRYSCHAHELRDVGITLAKSFGVDPLAVQLFAGHEIDKLKYEKSPWDNPGYYREEYAKLGPALNVVSGREQLVRIAMGNEFELREKALKEDFEERLARLERQILETLSVRP